MTGMSDDQLRSRLSRLDPVPAGSPVDAVPSPRASELMEHAMQNTDLYPDASSVDELGARRRRRRPLLLGAAAAAVLVALVGGGLLLGNGDTPVRDEAPTTLALELPGSDVAASCIRFDVQILAEGEVALAGTATAVEAERVTLDVDRWYRGGDDADTVTIAVPGQDSSAALDGVDFRVGERYLVTATEGVVRGCGYSGAATPELERAFQEAFAG
jgi:hypothetical protein